MASADGRGARDAPRLTGARVDELLRTSYDRADALLNYLMNSGSGAEQRSA